MRSLGNRPHLGPATSGSAGGGGRRTRAVTEVWQERCGHGMMGMRTQDALQRKLACPPPPPPPHRGGGPPAVPLPGGSGGGVGGGGGELERPVAHLWRPVVYSHGARPRPRNTHTQCVVAPQLGGRVWGPHPAPTPRSPYAHHLSLSAARHQQQHSSMGNSPAPPHVSAPLGMGVPSLRAAGGSHEGGGRWQHCRLRCVKMCGVCGQGKRELYLTI